MKLIKLVLIDITYYTILLQVVEVDVCAVTITFFSNLQNQ